jgi:hypothetical protein
MSFGFSADPQGILTVIEKINQHRNKNKNEICLALQLMDSFIAKWYDDYVRIFSRTIGLNGKTLDDASEMFQKIFAFTHRKVYHRLAEQCVDYLVEGLYKGYHSEGNYRFRDIIEEAGGIAYVRDLANSIAQFSHDAYGGKQKWIEKALEEKRWNISATDITQMLQNLQTQSEQIREITSKLRQN